ncbi:hypothetical protein BKA70DRAFT_1301832 [Coprinopsis sp. MPI-PUGE-AT-0042]|nr:hypothetical protein BKA70DRAFT_1301832 [Coprinopsis sp. MPI-PUGE-AT-0042]
MASLEHILNWSLRFTFGYASAAMCCSAIQIFMWIYMASFYLEAQPDVRKRRLPYMIASLVILLLSCGAAVAEGLYIYTVLLEVAPGPENAAEGLGITGTYNVKLLSLGGLLRDISTRFADGVLLYRCYIVWASPWIVTVPIVIWLVGAGIGLRTYIPFDFDNPTLNTVDLSLLVGLNILITAIISFRLIRAHRKLGKVLPHTNHKLYLNIVAILVESAAPLAIFGIGLIIVRHLYPGNIPVWKAGTIIEIFYLIAASLAPQLIIFRVATGSSWANRTDTNSAFSRGLEFAGPDETQSDEESK